MGQIIGWLLTVLFFMLSYGHLGHIGKLMCPINCPVCNIVFPMGLVLWDTWDTLFLNFYKNINI